MEPKKRKLQILAAIIEYYVETGEPIGSKALAGLLGDTVSSATLRNDMAALAESGYLDQPHTSAGRVPTQRGYRMYVDRLMSCRTLPEDIMRHIDVQLTAYSMDPERFLTHAAGMLSSMTGMAAVATTPTATDSRVTGLEIMATGRHTCIMLLMVTPTVLKTRICRMELDLTDEFLGSLKALLRGELCGKPLSEIDHRTVAYLKERLGSLGEAVEPLLIAIREAARVGTAELITLDGQERLLERAFFSDQALRGMLGFLSDRERLGSLISSSQSPINVYIGSECGHPELNEASVITSKYRSGGGAAGWVGVIGPQRMNYSRIIPCIQYFSTTVGRIMSAIESDTVEE